MNSKTPSLELVPLELNDPADRTAGYTPAPEPAPPVAAPTVAALSVAAPSVTTPNAASMVVAGVDKYFAAATAEFEKGDIDQPLWDRALGEAKGDREKAIINYLRTRATSLKVSKREPRTITYAPVVRDVEDPPSARAIPKNVAASEPEKAKPPAKKFNARVVTIAAACAGVVVCASLLYVFLGSALSPKPDVASAATPMNRAKPTTAAVTAKPAPKTAPDPDEELLAKIGALRLAGNWHVLVLYAGEWTRREPLNAAAWNELSLGYERLHQFDDAYNAATKAVALAPEIPLYWRNLGQLDLQLNLPEEALRAYEGATSLNDRDMHSLVRSGILYWRLARLPEAKVASDKALALSPEDPDALCLKSLLVNRQVAPKAVPGAAKQTLPRDATCREMTEAKDAPLVANSSTAIAVPVVPRKR